MNFENIRYEVDQGVAVLTLNRPQSLNSFNADMHAEVRNALDDARINDAVRCVLITGEGRGFCAGQDLSDRAMSDDSSPRDLGETVDSTWNPMIRRVVTLEKPVVCAVNGIAAGAGASLAIACDIVLAARSAAFAFLFCKIGLIPDTSGTFHLPRHVGLARAKGLAMTGEKLPAEKAEDWGLIWRAVDDEALMDEALAMARSLATQPTRGLGRTKTLMNQSHANDFHQQIELEKYSMREMGTTEDYREGVTAFLEKRAPEFKGK